MTNFYRLLVVSAFSLGIKFFLDFNTLQAQLKIDSSPRKPATFNAAQNNSERISSMSYKSKLTTSGKRWVRMMAGKWKIKFTNPVIGNTGNSSLSSPKNPFGKLFSSVLSFGNTTVAFYLHHAFW